MELRGKLYRVTIEECPFSVSIADNFISTIFPQGSRTKKGVISNLLMRAFKNNMGHVDFQFDNCKKLISDIPKYEIDDLHIVRQSDSTEEIIKLQLGTDGKD